MDAATDKLRKWLPFLLGTCTALGMYAGYKMQGPKQWPQPSPQLQTALPYPTRQKLEDVLSYLQSKYVDSLNHHEVTDFLIEQLLFALDPYSEYLSPHELVNLEDNFDGLYQGAGLSFRIIGQQVYIGEMVPDSPAQIAGLRSGEIVLKINDHNLEEQLFNIDSIIAFAKEDPDKIHLSVRASGERLARSLTIEKTDLPNRSTGPVFSMDDKTFYIRINSFTETTYREFMKAVEEYVYHRNHENLILDLRFNSGGILGSAADILNQLTENPDVVMFYTRDRNDQKREYKSTGRPFFKFGKIAVLINDETASASEVLAGSLQDMHRATIIGTPSFGKATVLEIFPLADGSSLELANARIYLPSGRCIQKPYNVRPDSNLHWLSPYQADTAVVVSGSNCYPSGRGVIPDILLEAQPVPSDEDKKITELSRDFTLLNYDALSDLLQKKNASSLISTFVLRQWINRDKDPFLLRHKDECIREVQEALLRYTSGEDAEEVSLLRNDDWVETAMQIINKN